MEQDKKTNKLLTISFQIITTRVKKKTKGLSYARSAGAKSVERLELIILALMIGDDCRRGSVYLPRGGGCGDGHTLSLD